MAIIPKVYLNSVVSIGVRDEAKNIDFPIILHFYTATDTQQVMKREPIFPQHFHNNFICREAKGNFWSSERKAMLASTLPSRDKSQRS